MKNNIKIQTNDQDTIVALSTPHGPGAIAIIRVTGTDAITIVNAVSQLSGTKKLQDQDTHTIHYGSIINPENPQEIIDAVLFLLFKAPKTFTGHDTIEINCHNNRFIIEKIINILIKQGARPAQPGEFCKRAFLNNKIDLIQAEAINDLIHAQSEFALKKSLQQLEGSLSFYIKELEQDLIKLLSFVEASFEFIEEEQQDINLIHKIESLRTRVINKIFNLKSNFNQQERIKTGIKITLIGRVNTGKSTLFNSLIQKDRAIVSHTAGTTRDYLEASIYKNGMFITYIDTAGLRSATDPLEQEGIKRTLHEAAASDIIILVFDNIHNISQQEIFDYSRIYNQYKEKIILVFNKCDLCPTQSPEDLQGPLGTILGTHLNSPPTLVSGHQKTGLQALESIINAKISHLLSTMQSPFLLNQRQYLVISEIEPKLQFLVKPEIHSVDYELIAYQLKEALEKLSELTGRNVTEQALDAVFDTFCVGK
jgi:tRNA modification GTPase